jgi:superoxide dismutase
MAAALCFIRTPKIDVDRLVHKISQFFSASARLREKLRAEVLPIFGVGFLFLTEKRDSVVQGLGLSLGGRSNGNFCLSETIGLRFLVF